MPSTLSARSRRVRRLVKTWARPPHVGLGVVRWLAAQSEVTRFVRARSGGAVPAGLGRGARGGGGAQGRGRVPRAVALRRPRRPTCHPQTAAPRPPWSSSRVRQGGPLVRRVSRGYADRRGRSAEYAFTAFTELASDRHCSPPVAECRRDRLRESRRPHRRLSSTASRAVAPERGDRHGRRLVGYHRGSCVVGHVAHGPHGPSIHHTLRAVSVATCHARSGGLTPPRPFTRAEKWT